MTQAEFADVIQFLAALAVLLGFSSWIWKSILINASRDRYFVLRDHLFLMAAKGRIEFSNPAYKNLRSFLDWKIGRVNLPTIEMFLIAILHPKIFQSPGELQPMDHEIDKIEDENVKHALREIKNAALDVDVYYILFPSPALYILVGMIGAPLVAILFLPLFALKFGWIFAWQKNLPRIKNFLTTVTWVNSHPSVEAREVH